MGPGEFNTINRTLKDNGEGQSSQIGNSKKKLIFYTLFFLARRKPLVPLWFLWGLLFTKSQLVYPEWPRTSLPTMIPLSLEHYRCLWVIGARCTNITVFVDNLGLTHAWPCDSSQLCSFVPYTWAWFLQQPLTVVVLPSSPTFLNSILPGHSVFTGCQWDKVPVYSCRWTVILSHFTIPGPPSLAHSGFLPSCAFLSLSPV